jgi:hypothetical protein
MRFLRFAAAALVALGVRGANGQDQTLFPPPEAGEAIEAPQGDAPSGDAARMEMDESSRMLQGSGIPYSPYPAGLSYTLTPQPFRVPYPNRIYYPIPHYVRHCPYYPKGFYWGADWNRRLLGCNPWLIHGDKRFNPYLTQAKIQHHNGTPHRNASPAPNLGIAPGEYIHEMAPPMAAAKSSRRTSKVTKVTEVVVASKESTEATPTSDSKAAESSQPQASQVKFSEPDAGDESPTIAPKAKPAAKGTSRAGQRTLPKWQRPPVRR